MPWDFNASFGQSWRTHRHAAEAWDTNVGRDQIFHRFLDEPSIHARRASRRAVLGRGLPDLLALGRPDGLHHLRPEVEYVRDWIVRRWAYLEKKLE